MNRNCIVMVKFPSRQCSSMQYIFPNRTAHIHEMKIQRGGGVQKNRPFIRIETSKVVSLSRFTLI